MKDILMIAHFTQIPGEKGNGRFKYISSQIDKKKFDLEIVTTSFSHKTKEQRKINDKEIQELDYKLTMLYEPGYGKNVSLKRFYSHYILGTNLKKYLKTRKKPDVLYCAVPSLDVAKVAAKYSKENNIRFIIDIQDLWPEAFSMVFNNSKLSDILLYPIKKQADYIYSLADEVIAVSKTYSDRALSINKKCKKGHSVFLGTELTYFDKLSTRESYLRKPNNEVWISYIGTLGHSYDITSVIDSLSILKNRGVNNIKFIVMGDGPLKSKFEKYAKKLEIYSTFTGRLSYEDMVSVLVNCDIAINPITEGAAQSIINKVGDYAAAGLPVINTQECLEYRNLVENYNIGLNCKNGKPEDISNNIFKLYNDSDLRKKMGENNRKLAENKFDRKYTYKEILNVIKK